MSQSTEMTDTELLAKVARGLGWLPQYRSTMPWLTSLDACQRDLLPDLERRGIDAVCKFGDVLFYDLVSHGNWEAVDDEDIATLMGATPRQWCRAYVEAIGE